MSDEICTLTLRLEPRMAELFVALARRRGYSPTHVKREPLDEITVIFGSKLEKRKLHAAWCNLSCVGYGK
jgi:hypothetical protein